jgi:hypothetical protein
MTGMKTFSELFLLAVLLSGCSPAFRAGSAVALGRQELFQGQNADALEGAPGSDQGKFLIFQSSLDKKQRIERLEAHF